MTESESCCTPAVVYRNSRIPDMISYFIKNRDKNEAKDTILDNSPFKSRMSDTNLVIHIGFISAIGKNIINLDAFKQLQQKSSNHYFPL